ncbi:FtsB family cell division protein [Candidatus Fokinia crypta]|uniref:Septum formation family protein n=1 Tax=Candidatus Fokinia crypta TaxID=1920990 RepID=A0ABZ0UTZ5_9RICK|nr:septum formation initiator family protein [Candidatus Fokinia cryptica]WPX98158.1 Septum formation family protein [Candidatus Fokinia cryptica]
MKQYKVFLIYGLFLLYPMYHLFQGENSISAYFALDSNYVMVSHELKELKKRKYELEHELKLLKNDLSGDYMEETLRRVMGFSDEKEIIVFMGER